MRKMLLSLFVLLAPASAFAQTSVVSSEPLTTAQQECIAACMAPTAKSDPDAHPACDKMPPPAKRRIRAAVATAKSLTAAAAKKTDEIAALKRRVGKLEDSSGLLGRGADDSALDTLRAEVARSEKDLKVLKQQLEDLNREYGLMHDEITDVTNLYVELKEDVNRLNDLEKKMPYARLSARLGYFGLVSSDGTTFGGLTLGPRLSLQLAERTAFTLDTAAAMSFTRTPFGSHLRVGIEHEVAKKFLALTGGLSSTFAAYDDRLRAKSAFLMGDVGYDMLGYDPIIISMGLFAGTELDQDSPSFAYGGMMCVGVNLF